MTRQEEYDAMMSEASTPAEKGWVMREHAYKGNLAGVEALIAEGRATGHAYWNEREESSIGMDALGSAALGGHPECVKALLTVCDPKSPDERGYTALMTAIEVGHMECATLLAPVSDLTARSKGDSNALDIVDEYLSRQAKYNPTKVASWFKWKMEALPDALKPEALGKAAYRGDMREVEALVEDGLRTGKEYWNQPIYNGQTPLMMAAAGDQMDALKHFLALSSINPSLSDSGGKTALHYAAQQDRADCLKALLPYCDPNAQTRQGVTPLMFGMANDSPEVVKILAAVSDLNLKDVEGTTALNRWVNGPKSRGDALREIIETQLTRNQQQSAGPQSTTSGLPSLPWASATNLQSAPNEQQALGLGRIASFAEQRAASRALSTETVGGPSGIKLR